MAGRKDNGDGSITKRADGRWEARATLPDGKRKSFYGKTKDEVKKKLEQVKRDIHAGLPVVSEKRTVGQFLQDWLVGVKPQLRPGTYYGYQKYVNNHFLPAFNTVPLAKLNPQQVQIFYAKKLDSGLASSTVNRMHGMLHHAFKDAMRFGLVQRNVLDLVKAPRKSSREMTPLTEEQARIFLAGVVGDRFEALYVLALTTGMREGELLGLRWQDVDLEATSLVVHVAAHSVNGYGLFLSETKTSYSRRRIALTQVAVEALRRHRVQQNAERLSLGPIWDGALDLVFPNTVGKLVNPSNLVGRMFKPHLERLGLPVIRFHDLRHTAATLLLSRGVHVKVVSEMLGHSDIAITLRVYGHVVPHMQQLAADVMDVILATS